jgi:hypothetical protein
MPRSGFEMACTAIPAARNCPTTSFQPELSANAPWTRAMVRREPNDISEFFAGMGVPARFHADRDFGEHLHDLPPGDRRRAVLNLGAFERAGKRIARWLRAGGRIRHEDLLE